MSLTAQEIVCRRYMNSISHRYLSFTVVISIIMIFKWNTWKMLGIFLQWELVYFTTFVYEAKVFAFSVLLKLNQEDIIYKVVIIWTNHPKFKTIIFSNSGYGAKWWIKMQITQISQTAYLMCYVIDYFVIVSHLCSFLDISYGMCHIIHYMKLIRHTGEFCKHCIYTTIQYFISYLKNNPTQKI